MRILTKVSSIRREVTDTSNNQIRILSKSIAIESTIVEKLFEKYGDAYGALGLNSDNKLCYFLSGKREAGFQTVTVIERKNNSEGSHYYFTNIPRQSLENTEDLIGVYTIEDVEEKFGIYSLILTERK